MDLVVKTFAELTTDELFAIYKLRVAVFVVEQQCPYQEVDDADKSAYHIFFRDAAGIGAYLRLLPPTAACDAAVIGRVIAAKRRRGLGTRIVQAGMQVAVERLRAQTIQIEAQTYAKGLYEKLGFAQSSGEFLEDGIPHIAMVWRRHPQPATAIPMQSVQTTRFV